MRIPRRVPVVLGAAIALTGMSAVAVAVTSHPSTAKACVTSKGVLALAKAGGKCASGTTALTLGAQGPAGSKGATGKTGKTGDTGARGPRGTTGARGPQGAPGSAIRVNFSQSTPEAAADSHYVATAGGVSLIVSCLTSSDTSPNPAAPTLELALTGLTQGVTFSASETSNETGTDVTSLVHDVAKPEQAPGAAASDITKVFDTEAPTDPTTDSVSDLVTVVAQADDGTVFTASLDAELADPTASPDGPACTVDGTVAAA